MRKLIVPFALLLTLLLACGDEETQVAATQITLTVQADAALRTKLDNLRATLFVNTGASWSRRSSVDVPGARLRWPLDIPILARPEDESAQIEVIVEAFASEQRLAQARVVTRFIKGSVALADTMLFECAGRAPGFVCAEDTCHGETCAVCSNTGACIAVGGMIAEDAGRSVEDEDAGAPHQDAGIVADAATSVEDAATAPPDAATPVDAGPPPATCPENACVAPYVCITTPAGYTCRGQFADWPMPDSTPGAKVAPSYTATPDFVTDNVTKLIWQLGVPRIIPGCTEYYTIGGGGKGDTGELCTRAQGKAYCDNLVHGGFDDWRMPTIIELTSLIDGQSDSAYYIDGSAFADTDYGAYVSESTYAGGPSQVWGSNYLLSENYFAAGYAGKVRCVRAGAVPSFAKPSDRYLVAEDRVTDQATGLIWQRKPATTKFAAEPNDAGIPEATTACAAPWRLPTLNELVSLVDFTRSMPAIDPQAFPETPSEYFYGVPNDRQSAVNFQTGSLLSWKDEALVRCVQ